MYYEFNEAGQKLFNIWADKYDQENDKLGGNSSNGDYVEGWSIVDNSEHIHTLDDLCGLYVFGEDGYAIDHVNEWIEDCGINDKVGYGINATIGDLKEALKKYYVFSYDNSNQIIEDIKWFMFDDQDSVENITNEFGFSHGLKFETWTGDQHSFVVTNIDGEKYRIMITKENN